MRLDIVTPERQLASLDITSVQIPGMNGDLTVMPNHAPFLTTLRPGTVVVESSEGRSSFVVTGGFAEISPESASILAEMAVPEADVTPELLDAAITEAREALDLVDDAGKAAAAMRLNDLERLKQS